MPLAQDHAYPAETGGFALRPDRAALTGTIVWTRLGKARGTLGCAEIFLDASPSPSEDEDQRYVAANGLPAPLSALPATTRAEGRFYFGNVSTGKHSLKVSLDGGRTFVGGEQQIFVPFTRDEAKGPSKNMLVQTTFEVPSDEDPTPAGCAF